ncbi:MAG: MFS transporter, partial [Halobacteria archaeon]|nr:MFS transporter [Halobacteria archaeon]
MNILDTDIDRRVLVLALARMADSIGNSFLIVVLPIYIESELISGSFFGFSIPLITGIILSMFGFVNSFAQPITGRLSDRAGKRKVFVIFGLVLLASVNLAYSIVGSYWGLLVIRALQGIGVAFTVTATIALVNELSTTMSRGGSMGIYNTFRLIGFGIGPVMGGAIVHNG